jgi:hypothetical protein
MTSTKLDKFADGSSGNLVSLGKPPCMIALPGNNWIDDAVSKKSAIEREVKALDTKAEARGFFFEWAP